MSKYKLRWDTQNQSYTVVDTTTGQQVSNAYWIGTSFSHKTIHTSQGTINEIAQPITAKLQIGAQTFSNVPVDIV
jgi:hypothetical protein